MPFHCLSSPCSLPFLGLPPLPFLGLPLPSLGLPLPFLDLPLPFSDLPLPFLGLPLPSLDLPLPSFDLPLPSLGLPRSSIRYALETFATDKRMAALRRRVLKECSTLGPGEAAGPG